MVKVQQRWLRVPATKLCRTRHLLIKSGLVSNSISTMQKGCYGARKSASATGWEEAYPGHKTRRFKASQSSFGSLSSKGLQGRNRRCHNSKLP